MPHINKEIDYTVSAYLIHNDSVLLIHHKALQMWLPLGGHIEPTEDPEEALFREIEEESGIQRSKLEVLSSKPDIISEGSKFLFTPNRMDIHQISKTHRHVGMVYYLRSRTNNLRLAEKEHNQIRWFDKYDLAKEEFNLKPAVRFYAEEALSLDLRAHIP